MASPARTGAGRNSLSPASLGAERQQHPPNTRQTLPRLGRRGGGSPTAHAAAAGRDSGLGSAHHPHRRDPLATHSRPLNRLRSPVCRVTAPLLSPPHRPVSRGSRRDAARPLPAGPALPFFFFLRFFLAPSSAPSPAAPPSAPSFSSGSGGSSPLRCFSASAAALPACPTPAMSPRPRRPPTHGASEREGASGGDGPPLYGERGARREGWRTPPGRGGGRRGGLRVLAGFVVV